MRPRPCAAGQRADGHEQQQRQHLADHQHHAGARGRAHADDVDPGEEAQRDHDHRDATQAGASPRPEACDRIGQRIAERRGRTDAGQPDHPADLETGETAERLARIQVAATRLIEVAGGLRVAQHQQRDDDAGGDHAPQAEGPEQGDGRRSASG
ncbi:hypothetical protein G6F62_013789 [Rhizopus arrhizus]|nr:hypothetical protein G6F24_015588 [Rhizopus arrhizus]KAG1315262.1 hypothetical protein G6F62_013789 [Rhizopus arrhizus]KAG1599605.1 hypothetical protein G6F46_014082 [Rhizopus delemar]